MNKPIMAKATAVWLVDNTTITFKQVADFCGLHELEVQGIADGDVATGVIRKPFPDIDFAGWVAPSFLGRPVMMLPIESLTEDVLAHELVHVALIHRWGYWRTLRDLPEWVNEGLAMQVDHRASFAFRNLCYLLDGDPMPVIEHLDSQASFYAASSRRLTARYSYVKQVVERTDIPGFLVAYDRGGRFEDVGTGFFKDLSANEVC